MIFGKNGSHIEDAKTTTSVNVSVRANQICQVKTADLRGVTRPVVMKVVRLKSIAVRGGEVHEAVVTLHILHATHPTLFRLVRHCALCSFSEIRTFVHSFPVGKRTTSLRLRDAWTFLTGCLHLSGMVAGTAADRNFDAVSHANCGIGNSRARREGSRKSGLEENLFD